MKLKLIAQVTKRLWTVGFRPNIPRIKLQIERERNQNVFFFLFIHSKNDERFAKFAIKSIVFFPPRQPFLVYIFQHLTGPYPINECMYSISDE